MINFYYIEEMRDIGCSTLVESYLQKKIGLTQGSIFDPLVFIKFVFEIKFLIKFSFGSNCFKADFDRFIFYLILFIYKRIFSCLLGGNVIRFVISLNEGQP